MPNIAYYTVLKDSKFTLSRGSDPWRHEWTPPGDTRYGSSAVLSFIADPSKNAELSLEVEVNGTVVRTLTLAGGTQRGMWEVIGNLERGDNQFRFTVTRGSGSVAVGDVVLWYKRTI